ncbi:MAG: indole-3-glycerol phosphate synthase TrpC [Actinobacteria bacterium]|nr:indole-3-glycerol phosphate synthase TrpC [Actinomycetota bacterium]
MTVLDEIVAHHRRRVGDDPRLPGPLVDAARSADPPRPFVQSLTGPELSVIAEVKRRSPSKGDIAPDLDAGSLAEAYAAGGAACLSVLTDERFFGGLMSDLTAARAASGLPVLRKDFTLSTNDVCDARLAGADAVLLIVAVLDYGPLCELMGLAHELAMGCLVEAHDEREIETAIEAGAQMIGVNQRDLADFSVDPERAVRLAKLIPQDVVAVAESGISDPADARRAADAGYHALLVGEALVRSADPARAVRELRCS